MKLVNIANLSHFYSTLPEAKHVRTKIFFLVVSLIISQYILRFGLFDNSKVLKTSTNLKLNTDIKGYADYHWWRLIFWRSLLQCSLTFIVILSKQLLHCRTTNLRK